MYNSEPMIDEIYCSDILTKDFLKKYSNKKVDWKFGDLSYIVFKRTYSRTKENGETEAWHETIARTINGAQKIGAKYSKSEAERLFDYMFNLKCFFSGRGLWQLGTKTVDIVGMDSLLNCWVTKVSNIDDFFFIFTESMLGGGVGCNISKEYTQELPRVKRGVRCIMKNTKDADFIVPDSKEGWAYLWRKILRSYLETGESFTYSNVCIRPAGEPLKTFGGIAPGPLPLMDGVKELCSILEKREGKKLRTQDVADIICCGGQVVKSGGIRRTALILLGDVDDVAFLHLKRWDLDITTPSYRSNSNNSLICSNFGHLINNYWEGFEGNGEAYGLFNLKNAKRYGRLGETKIGNFDLFDDGIIAPNPCQPSWAKVLTKDGIRQFKDISIGDFIWSKEGWTKIINKWSTGIKPVLEYRTTAGVFNGTENHRIVSNGEKVEVSLSDGIDIFEGEYKTDITLNPQDIMDGLVLGDGSVHKASNNLIYLCVGMDDQDYFQSEVKDLFYEDRPGLSPYAHEIETTLIHEELPHTYNRSVPDRFLYGDRNKICGFLRGLYSANGSICGERVTLKATSFKIIEDVQLLLSSVGIRSYYTTNSPTTIKFSNGEYDCKKSYDLNISTDREKFQKIIGFIQSYKNHRLSKIIEKVNSNSRRKNTYDIISVNKISEEEVFDITVDNKSHTYWTQGCDVSNCAEALLADKECCNLAELAINNIGSKEEMLDCSILLYKAQKAIAANKYLFNDTNEIVNKNMRLGLGITGVCQNPNYKEWSDYVYKNLREFDKKYSKDSGWPQSIRLTVVKPSGTLSLLSGSSPGANAGYSKYHYRTVRFSSMDKLVPLLKDAGYRIEPEKRQDKTLNHDIAVVYFPCKFSEDTICEDTSDCIDQLNRIKDCQQYWADQAVSNTIYYNEQDLPKIKQWLKENYNDSVKTVSFLLHYGHGFEQAVLQPITKEEYDNYLKSLKLVNVKEDKSNGEILNSLECASGACPIR